MGKFDKLMELIEEKNNGAMEMAEEVINSVFCTLKDEKPSLYEDAVLKLESIAYTISEEDAMEIVKSMKPYGQKWSYDEVSKYITEKGIENSKVDYYLVMNMMYNDYYETAKSIERSSDVEFYFSLAKNFIEDVDGKPCKVGHYFLD